jgi:hypothetical protein
LLSIFAIKWNVNNHRLLTLDLLFAFHLWCEMKCYQSQVVDFRLPACLPSLRTNELWRITSCWLLIACMPSICDVKRVVNNHKLLTSDYLFALHLWGQMKCEQSQVGDFWLPVFFPSRISNEMRAILRCWLVIASLLSIFAIKWNVNNNKLLTSHCLFTFHLWC